MATAQSESRSFRGLKKEITRYRRRGADAWTSLETQSRKRIDALEKEVAELRAQLSALVGRALTRVYRSLNVPTRDEIHDLAERLDALDAKLHDLEKGRGATSKKVKKDSKKKAKKKSARSSEPLPS